MIPTLTSLATSPFLQIAPGNTIRTFRAPEPILCVCPESPNTPSCFQNEKANEETLITTRCLQTTESVCSILSDNLRTWFKHTNLTKRQCPVSTITQSICFNVWMGRVDFCMKVAIGLRLDGILITFAEEMKNESNEPPQGT